MLHMMSGFLLGLASGTGCLATCAPALTPYLVSEGRGVGFGMRLLGRFLLGRLFGYLAFGLLAGLFGGVLMQSPVWRARLIGSSYLCLAGLLLVYGFRNGRTLSPCTARDRVGFLRRLRGRWPASFPFLLGLLTGLNFCPPFALALAGAAGTGSVAGSILFFLTFFMGTSVFFLPLPGLGGLRRFQTLRLVARLATGVVGAYYLYRGLILFVGGLV
jgi:sulfite exporter TauE/SafE